jgi:hypothetical protein
LVFGLIANTVAFSCHFPQKHSVRSVTLAYRTVAALTILFIVVVWFLAFEQGVCCADDGIAASVAKNLAFAKGYAASLSVSGEPGLFSFNR